MKIIKKSLIVFLTLIMIIMIIGCSIKSSNELETKNKYWLAYRNENDNVETAAANKYLDKLNITCMVNTKYGDVYVKF